MPSHARLGKRSMSMSQCVSTSIGVSNRVSVRVSIRMSTRASVRAYETGTDAAAALGRAAEGKET